MNPIYSVERATNRRNVVLQRMLDENTSLKQNTMLRVPNCAAEIPWRRD